MKRPWWNPRIEAIPSQAWIFVITSIRIVNLPTQRPSMPGSQRQDASELAGPKIQKRSIGKIWKNHEASRSTILVAKLNPLDPFGSFLGDSYDVSVLVTFDSVKQQRPRTWWQTFAMMASRREEPTKCRSFNCWAEEFPCDMFP